MPPPESIDYHQLSYVQRLAARAVIEIDGVVPDHTGGALQVWRYRAANGLDICNGNRIDDRKPCSGAGCPIMRYCGRVALRN